MSLLQEPPLCADDALQLINHDLKPVEPARRQWSAWNFVGFWIADSFNVTTWMISSSMIVAGMSWWQSWLCVWIGYAIAACFVCAVGHIGATYHIGFPVLNRASFGIWGALWPVFNRAAMGEFLAWDDGVYYACRRSSDLSSSRLLTSSFLSMCLVRSAVLYRRSLRVLDDPRYLEELGK